MSNKITFDYFYGKEADMLTFYRIPKLLFTNDYFENLSTDGKVLYGLMLDRMSLSLKNGWFDAENRAFIYFSIEEAMDLLKCKKNKIVDLMKRLEDVCLIERRRQGQGKPSVIYVKNFAEQVSEDFQKLEKQTSETENEVQRLEKSTSRSLENQPLEVGKSRPNNIEINNTNIYKSNPITSADKSSRLDDEYTAYSEIIRQNLELDLMYERYPFDRELLDGIYDLILETVLCQSGTVVVAKNEYPVQLVKSKFLKLNSSHLEYVMDCMKQSTSKVRNIKKYLLAALFNAPTTMGGYYQAEVNHDFPQYANAK